MIIVIECQCPWCEEKVIISQDICPNCLHEVLFDHEGNMILNTEFEEDFEEDFEAQENTHSYDDIKDHIYATFRCESCNCKQCELNEVAMTGTGMSKILDIQHHHYLFVSCSSCGRVEIFNPDVLLKRKKGTIGSIIDTAIDLG